MRFISASSSLPGYEARLLSTSLRGVKRARTEIGLAPHVHTDWLCPMVAVLRIAALAAVLALYVHVVRAVVMDGRLAFVSDDVDGSGWCWGHFTVFDESGRRVWAFQSYPVFGSVRFRGLGTTPLAFVVGV